MNKLEIEEEYEGLIIADGFEDAFMGVVEQFNSEPIAVYDKQKCIDILMERDGMDWEGAMEFFDYNVQGAWVGKRTPMFFTPSR